MEINLSNVKSLLPPAFFRLSRVREGEFAYQYYRVRHPAAVFSTNLTDTISAYNSLAFKVINLQAQEGPANLETIEELKILTQNLLLCLARYFESGYEVFQNFVPKVDQPKQNQELFKWFEQQNIKEVAEYFKSVDPHLGIYRRFLNALKHSSNRISIFQFMTPSKGSTYGFYLEGVNALGAIAPVEEFHPLYQGRHTAWSFNFHLKNIFFIIYKIAEEIDVVTGKLLSSQNLNLEEVPAPLVSENLEKILKEALNHTLQMNRGRFHFPQESIQTTFVPKLAPDNSSLGFQTLIPAEAIVPVGSKVSFTSRGDGFSRSWVLPYFGGK